MPHATGSSTSTGSNARTGTWFVHTDALPSGVVVESNLCRTYPVCLANGLGEVCQRGPTGPTDKTCRSERHAGRGEHARPGTTRPARVSPVHHHRNGPLRRLQARPVAHRRPPHAQCARIARNRRCRESSDRPVGPPAVGMDRPHRSYTLRKRALERPIAESVTRLHHPPQER